MQAQAENYAHNQNTCLFSWGREQKGEIEEPLSHANIKNRLKHQFNSAVKPVRCVL